MEVNPRPTLGELAATCRVLGGAYRDTFWRHYKDGDIYQITSLSIDEATGVSEFEYRPVHLVKDHGDARIDGVRFNRPFKEWMEIIVRDGEPVPRFTQVYQQMTYA